MQRRLTLLASAVACALAATAFTSPAIGAASTPSAGTQEMKASVALPASADSLRNRPTAVFLTSFTDSQQQSVGDLTYFGNTSDKPPKTETTRLIITRINPTGAIAVSRSLITTTSGTWTAIGSTPNGRLAVGVEALS